MYLFEYIYIYMYIYIVLDVDIQYIQNCNRCGKFKIKQKKTAPSVVPYK